MWKVFESQDGSTSVFSEKFGVSYHSKYGAIQESKHVFIEAGLYAKAISKKELTILELGLGTGLNALLSFLESEKLKLKVHYTGIERHPLPQEIISKLNFLERIGNGAEAFQILHDADWGKPVSLSPNFTFKKIYADFSGINFQKQFDLLYFDAFAPNVQPELWETPLLQKCFDSLLPGGHMVTYCAKGAFKRTLKSIGFEVDVLKGPPGKREMTRAIRPKSQQR